MEHYTELQQFDEEWQALAFGAALVARMGANYQLFSEVAEMGDTPLFGNMLNLVWEFVGGKNQRIDFQKQLDKLELITPDPKLHDIYGVWPALDATVAMATLLGACERFDLAEIGAIADLSTATIQGYIEAVGDDVEGHPLLLAEQDCIVHLLQLIAEKPGQGRGETVASLKVFLSSLELSNIGLARE